MKAIPFYDLHREYVRIKPEIDKAVKTVLHKQKFILGEELSAFEKEFASYLGVRFCVGVGSGTDGLILGLMAAGIKSGDEVITQANSFIATAYAISIVGAVPVLVDVDPVTHQINAEDIEKKITKKTRAIMPVHLFGSPAPIKAVLKLAKKYDLKVIEDACQAHGGRQNKKKLGSFGDISVFSFYPSKNLGAYGDAGAVCTNSKEVYKKLLLLRNYGQKMKYEHIAFGTNSRLDELQAAILRAKLKHLDSFILEREKIAHIYNAGLRSVTHPRVVEHGSSAYHLYVVNHNMRDKLKKYLEKHGINTLIHYPIPIHLQLVYSKKFKWKKGSFPVAEGLAKTSLSLPMFVGLTRREIDYIVSTVNSFR